MIKTTQKDFNIFEKATRKWIDIFALHEFELYIEKRKMEGDCSDAIATCSANEEGMSATICLSAELPYKLTKKDLEEKALHEVLELLLWNLATFAPSCYPKHVVAKEVHVIIQKFINTFKRGVLKVV